jgi:hypothetical protein
MAPTFTPAELDYLRTQRLGRLATVDGSGAPQNMPMMSREVIRITPRWIVSWGVDPAESGMNVRR